MPTLRQLAYALSSLILFALPARATWSILIVDLATGEVAVGIATCLTGFDLRPSTIVVVPGYGVAAAQSFVGPLSLRQIIRTELLNGTPTNQILAMLAAADTGHQSRQYGIAGVVHGTTTFTGNGAGAWAGGLTGQTGTLVYTVQGNVLTGQPVIQAAETAILTTVGTIGDKLMAAMEAARSMGGDGRCSCATTPTACGSPPVSFTKAAHIGLMIVSRPSDIDAPCNGTAGCGAGDYWLDLNIANQTVNDPDPVFQLQALYNTWRAQQVGRPDHFRSAVTMNGSHLRANGIDTLTGTVWLRDAQGNALGNSLPVTVGLSARSTVTGVTFGPAVPQANGSYAFTMRGNFGAGEAIVDVAVDDGLGRVGVWPQPMIIVDDAFGSCGSGAIGDGSGGVIDALRIGGSAGQDRVIETGLGQPFVLTIDPPVGASTTLPVGLFALWAHLGMPRPTSILPLGPGAGALCFTPFPLDPLAPTLLLADGFGLGGFIAATPAPWTLGFPGVPALLDFALQAAMVVDLQGTVAATNAILLRTTTLPAPFISTITPTVAAAGAPVTLAGNNFFVGAELRVGGNPTPITSMSPTAVSFTMPSGHGCDTTISIANLGTAASSRVINGTPNVTTQYSTSGPAAGGASFIITGQNLGAATVTFNGVPMTITVQNATAIVGTTPPGTPGPATVIVGNAIGCQDVIPYTYL
ncbi:MAG: DUF1028 domain-containing protein [Planctomycetes bacterium]|nr:DUF1028 domain-containing protein [Planctomycetota bacterium]